MNTHKTNAYLAHANFAFITGRIFWGCNTVCGISRAADNYMLWLSCGNKVIVRASDTVLITEG